MGDLEERLRSRIKNEIIRENRLSGPICGEADRMLDKLVDMRMEDIAYDLGDHASKYRFGN